MPHFQQNANSSFEALFSRLLDVLIFTSAIVITAYSYITGTLLFTEVQRPPPPPPPIYKPEQDDLIKIKRIKECEQEQKPITRKKRHSSASLDKKVQLPRDKKRTQSLSSIPSLKQEEMISRMEERLQLLIQQGQEALSK